MNRSPTLKIGTGYRHISPRLGLRGGSQPSLTRAAPRPHRATAITRLLCTGSTDRAPGLLLSRNQAIRNVAWYRSCVHHPGQGGHAGADSGSVLTSVAVPIAKEHKMFLFDVSGTGGTFFTKDNPYIGLIADPVSTIWPKYIADFLDEHRRRPASRRWRSSTPPTTSPPPRPTRCAASSKAPASSTSSTTRACRPPPPTTPC